MGITINVTNYPSSLGSGEPIIVSYYFQVNLTEDLTPSNPIHFQIKQIDIVSPYSTPGDVQLFNQDFGSFSSGNYTCCNATRQIGMMPSEKIVLDFRLWYIDDYGNEQELSHVQKLINYSSTPVEPPHGYLDTPHYERLSSGIHIWETAYNDGGSDGSFTWEYYDGSTYIDSFTTSINHGSSYNFYIYGLPEPSSGYYKFKLVNNTTGEIDDTKIINITPTTCNIHISSTPSGATVFAPPLVGSWTTPIDLDLPSGSYNISIGKEGFETYTQTIYSSPGISCPSDISVTLTPTGPTGTGSVSVSSTPSGAEIYLDGADTGYTTPHTLYEVSAGDHSIRLELSGYEPFTTTVTVYSGETASISPSLHYVGEGTVSVSSTPSGAEIYLDTIDTGFTTSHNITASVGNHTISLVLSGYEPLDIPVSIVSGTNPPISVTLTPATSGYGYIMVSSTPSGAEIYLDNIDTYVKTPGTVSAIPGTHSITVKKFMYTSTTKNDITVTEGTITNVDMTLQYNWLLLGSIPLTMFGGYYLYERYKR